MLTTIKRIFKAGAVGFARSAYVSFAAIFIIFVTLLVIGSSNIFGHILANTLEGIKDKVDVNVYFVTTANDADIMAFKQSLESLPEVKDVEYTSRDDALTGFRERHKDDSLTLAALDELGDNPLGASLSIRAHDPSQYEGIVNYINTEVERTGTIGSFVDRVNYDQNKNAIERLTNIIRTTDRISYAVSVVLICVAVLITFNTIRLAIYTAREEISVMRLVGASNMFIRGPFIVQGVMYGFIAGVLALVALYPILVYMGPGIQSFFEVDVLAYYGENFLSLAWVLIGSGVGLGVIASVPAISRYLKI